MIDKNNKTSPAISARQFRLHLAIPEHVGRHRPKGPFADVGTQVDSHVGKRPPAYADLQLLSFYRKPHRRRRMAPLRGLSDLPLFPFFPPSFFRATVGKRPCGPMPTYELHQSHLIAMKSTRVYLHQHTNHQELNVQP